ncbi:hypothetical protein GF327_06680 [Candidatus Woesearchaeota archaeon]|nr:hypothetical protein [Candidatus Woesearchaeota archaeon]
MKQIGILVNLIITGILVLSISVTGFILLNSFPETQNEYSELYFEDFYDLPELKEINEKISFIFTIENKEKKPNIYTYAIKQETYDFDKNLKGKNTIEKDIVYLSSGEKRIIMKDFELMPPFSDIVKISVILENYNQSIHFWIRTFDKRRFNRTFYCGVDISDYNFNDEWERNDPLIKKAFEYCNEINN